MDKKQAKVGKVMREFKEGKLKSSSGQKVTNPKQAIAIGLSEAGLSRKKEGGEVESKKMQKKEIAFMKAKGAPKSMVKHEEKEYGMKKGGRLAAKGEHAVQKQSKRGAEMVKMASGGLTAGHKSADGCAVKGKTKGKHVAMKKGGYC